jgi:hypothetical protein
MNTKFELVKFYIHLKNKALNDDCSVKANSALPTTGMRGIDTKTLRQIENDYGYTQ